MLTHLLGLRTFFVLCDEMCLYILILSVMIPLSPIECEEDNHSPVMDHPAFNNVGNKLFNCILDMPDF